MITGSMYMNRERATQRINSLLDVHIEALDGDPKSKRVAQALANAKPDFKNLINEIFDEIEALEEQHRTNVEAGVEQPE